MKNRTDITKFDKIPNVGPATIRYLNMLGINKPFELIGQDPYSMYGYKGVKSPNSSCNLKHLKIVQQEV